MPRKLESDTIGLLLTDVSRSTGGRYFRARDTTEFAGIYDRARAAAATSLRRHNEPAAADQLPATCPYSLDQVIGDWWP